MAVSDAELDRIATQIGRLFIEVHASTDDTGRVLAKVLAALFFYIRADKAEINEWFRLLRLAVDHAIANAINPFEDHYRDWARRNPLGPRRDQGSARTRTSVSRSFTPC